MKKILFITPFPPSTLGAGVNYTRQLLENLSNSFKIDLIYFKVKEESPYIPPNNNISIKYIFNTSLLQKILSVSTLPFIFPLFSAKFSVSKLRKIKALIKSEVYDCLYLDFSQMFLYGKYIRGINTIFMSHDIIGQRYERKNKILGIWAKLTERWVLKPNNKIFTFSKKDSDLLRSWYKVNSTPTQFYFDKNVESTKPIKINPYFVFFAMWKRPDNYEGLTWFLNNVLPELKEFQFKVIGGCLPENLKAIIATYENIEYLGFIDNPYPIIANSKALISPLFQGAGVKVKVLDALAVGTPIIGTDISFEGIDERYSPLMLNANNENQFIEQITNIDIPLSFRIEMKNMFIENNKSKEIIKYIQST